MEFLYPGFLYALAALAIPIAIHLFNFKRYKRVAFTRVKFLQELQEETKHQSQLKHLLVLISRLLAIAFLVFAFAQPFIPAQNQNKDLLKKVIFIYLDNSYSMEGAGSSGMLLDEAKELAFEVADAFEETQEFLFLNNEFNPKHLQIVSKNEVLDFIQSTQLNPSFKDIDEIFIKSNSLLKSFDGRVDAYVISDFQKSFLSSNFQFSDSNYSIYLLPIENQIKSNILIDSVWFEDPVRKSAQSEVLKVKIRNLGEDNRDNFPVKLFINSSQRALSNISLNAGQSKTIDLSYTVPNPGIVKGKVEINDYPITFDDLFYFSYNIDTAAGILLIYEGEEILPFTKLFDRDDFFRLDRQTANNVNYGSFSNYNFIIAHNIKTLNSGLSTALSNFVLEGGSLCFFPSEDLDLNNTNLLLSRLNIPGFKPLVSEEISIASLDFDHPLYKNVFESVPKNPSYPKVFKHYPSQGGSSGNAIISLRNNQNFLAYYPREKGKVYVFNSPLNNSSNNFGNNALFVPTLYQMALRSGNNQNIFNFITDYEIPLNEANYKKDKVYTLSSATTEIIPELTQVGNKWFLRTYSELQFAGNYILKENKSGQIMQGIALNNTRKESVPEYASPSEITAYFQKSQAPYFEIKNQNVAAIKASIQSNITGNELYIYFLIAALIMLLIELALLRFLP